MIERVRRELDDARRRGGIRRVRASRRERGGDGEIGSGREFAPNPKRRQRRHTRVSAYSPRRHVDERGARVVARGNGRDTPRGGGIAVQGEPNRFQRRRGTRADAPNDSDSIRRDPSRSRFDSPRSVARTSTSKYVGSATRRRIRLAPRRGEGFSRPTRGRRAGRHARHASSVRSNPRVDAQRVHDRSPRGNRGVGASRPRRRGDDVVRERVRQHGAKRRRAGDAKRRPVRTKIRRKRFARR